MTNHPSITVIMSVRNGEKYVEAAIDSILEQSYTDFEFFIMDDGSCDNTLSIITSYAKCSSQIRVFHNKTSQGLPTCLNSMAGHARGKYLARMDADDIAHENRFERQVEFMNLKPDVDVCFANVNLMDDEGQIVCARKVPSSSKSILKLLPYINYFAHPTALLRTSSFREIGGYDDLFFHGQDWELWQRMVSNGMRLEMINEILLDYRLNMQGNSMKLSGSRRKSDAFFIGNILITNGKRMEALLMILRLPIFEIPEYFIRLIMPNFLFLAMVKIRAQASNSSVQVMLMKQKNG